MRSDPRGTVSPTWVRDRLVSAASEVYPSDDVILVNTAGGAVTLSAPDASKMRGRPITVVNLGTNNVTFDCFGTDLCQGAGSKVWATQYQAYTFLAVLTATPNTFGWVIL